MSTVRAHSLLLLVALGASLLSFGCGGSEGRKAPAVPVPRDPDPNGRGLPSIDLYMSSDPIVSTVDRLLDTRTPTDVLLADLPGAKDDVSRAVIDLLRRRVAQRENLGWQVDFPDLEDPWGERRACSTDALRWHHGVEVRVHHLQLSNSDAAALKRERAAPTGYYAISLTESECLERARRGGRLLGSFGPIVLRGGETARLTAGWDRARLSTRVGDDGAVAETILNVFSGLRVAVTARPKAEEAGDWELGVFTNSGELEHEGAVNARAPGHLSQDYEEHPDGLTVDRNRLPVSKSAGCWLAHILGRHDDSEAQVLVCARVVEIE